MTSAFLTLLLLAVLSYARDTRSAPTAVTPPEFILPVQHVREVQNGYLTFKDHQLGSESAESDAKKKECVPRDSPEGIARLHIINKQLAEEAAGKADPQAIGGTDSAPKPTLEGTEAPAEPTEEAKDVPEEPSRPPFNDTTPFEGVDVGETMELRIYKPLCDD
ncbi:hypothetical protein Y032_0234g3146 [Ancylostoma ceylanicum]|uniref:Secreted protein n=1 Tax=Ancylostoma ceylanicum TaxID=53326 RepID=A0A016SFR9_9BILA|nr:hypothetical protein Y032_0234g3146 [Ancylostoma ceylanicum]